MSYGRRAFTLIELLAVVGIFCVLLALLLPFLSNKRKEAALSRLNADENSAIAQQLAANVQKDQASVQGAGEPARPAAHVKSFDADIALTPSLSVGRLRRSRFTR